MPSRFSSSIVQTRPGWNIANINSPDKNNCSRHDWRPAEIASLQRPLISVVYICHHYQIEKGRLGVSSQSGREMTQREGVMVECRDLCYKYKGANAEIGDPEN